MALDVISSTSSSARAEGVSEGVGGSVRSGRIFSGEFFPPVLVLLRKIVGVKCLSPFGAGALSTGEDALEARASSAVLLELFLCDA